VVVFSLKKLTPGGLKIVWTQINKPGAFELQKKETRKNLGDNCTEQKKPFSGQKTKRGNVNLPVRVKSSKRK